MKKIKVNDKMLEIFEQSLAANDKGVKGLDKIRECNRIYKAIDDAKDKKFIFLETTSFKFLKESMEIGSWIAKRESTILLEEAFDALEASEDYNPNDKDK